MTAKEARENTREIAEIYLRDKKILARIQNTMGYVYIHTCQSEEEVKEVTMAGHILGYNCKHILTTLNVKFDWSV